MHVVVKIFTEIDCHMKVLQLQKDSFIVSRDDWPRMTTLRQDFSAFAVNDKKLQQIYYERNLLLKMWTTEAIIHRQDMHTHTRTSVC